MQVYKPTDQSVNGVGEIWLSLMAMVFPLFVGLPFAYANKALFESTLELLFDQEFGHLLSLERLRRDLIHDAHHLVV